MKMKMITLSVFLMSSIFLYSQESIFNVGDKVLNFGLGIGSTFYSGTYYKSTFPPISISFEKGIVDEVLEKGVIGVGGYLGYSSYKYEFMDWGWKYSTVILGGRGSFHYPLVENIDTYTGVLLGYMILSSKEFGTSGFGVNYSSNASRILWSWYAGGRYYFSENIAAMLELGFGITYLNLGIALRI